MKKYVSILVLMELPLQRETPPPCVLLYIRFNPCFNGTTSATQFRRGQPYTPAGVSILVLMELPLQRPLER